MKIEDFLGYAYKRFINENTDEFFRNNYRIRLNNLIIFTTDDRYKNKEIDVLKEYHVGVISDLFQDIVNSLYKYLNISKVYAISYDSFLDKMSDLSLSRPTVWKDTLESYERTGKSAPGQKFFTFDLELSDVVYVKIKNELEVYEGNTHDRSVENIYTLVMNSPDSVINYVINKAFKIDDYLERLGCIAADYISAYSDSVFVNQIAKAEVSKRNFEKQNEMSPMYKVAMNPMISSNTSGMRASSATDIFLAYSVLSVYDSANKTNLINYVPTPVHKIASIFKAFATDLSIETAIQHLLTARMYDITYQKLTDSFSTIMRTFTELMMFNNNSYTIIDKLNDIRTVRLDARMQDKSLSCSAAEAKCIRESLETNGFDPALLLEQTTRLVISEAIFTLNRIKGEWEQTKLIEAKNDKLEAAGKSFKEKVSEKKQAFNDKVYEIKYKNKQYIIDKKKRRIEFLANDIAKDIHLLKSASKETMSYSEKQDLIARAHYLRDELMQIRHRAEKVNDEELIGFIDERLALVDEVINKDIQTRNITKERRSVAFTLERPLTDDLRSIQDHGNYDH